MSFVTNHIRILHEFSTRDENVTSHVIPMYPWDEQNRSSYAMVSPNRFRAHLLFQDYLQPVSFCEHVQNKVIIPIPRNLI